MTSAIKASLLRAKALYTGFVAGAPAVDGSTVEVVGGVLRVKAGGITSNELNDATLDALAVDESTLTQGAESIGIKAAGVTETEISAKLAGSADGAGFLRCMRVTFDPSAVAGDRTVAPHALGDAFPDEAIIVGGGVSIITPFDSADHSGELELFVQGDDDLVAVAAISGEPWSVAEMVEVFPTPTSASTWIELTAGTRQLTFDVTTTALTAGKCVAWVYYVVGA